MKRWKLLRGIMTLQLIFVLLACEGPGGPSPEPPTPGPPTPTAEASVPIASEATPVPIEDVTLTGNVVLPAGSTLVPSDLRIATNASTVPVDGNGDFSAPAVRGAENTSLAIALNAQGNAVLLRATRGVDTLAPGELSVASTARALVLFDPAILGLSPARQDQAAQLYAQDVIYPLLEKAVATALLADPADPLNADAHPDPYRLSGEIVAGLLPLLDAEGRAPQTGGRVAAPRPAGPIAAPTATAEERAYVDVIDDAEHKTPEVLLYNASFAYYRVTVVRDGTQWGEDRVLSRNKPLGAILHWPPGYYVTQPLEGIGDGELEVTFKKDNNLTAFDMFWTLMAQLSSIPAGNIVTMEPEIAAVLHGSAVLEKGLGDLGTQLEIARGKSFHEVGGEALKWIGTNGFRVALVVANYQGRKLAKANATEYAGFVARFLGSKAAWAVAVGYLTADLSAMAWSMANAPALAVVTDRQERNIYPAIKARTEPARITNAAPGQSVALSVVVQRIPNTIPEVRYVFKADGVPFQEIRNNQEGGWSVVTVKRVYAGESTIEVSVFDTGSGRDLVDLSIPVEGAALAPPAIPAPAGGGGVWVQTGVIRARWTPDPAATPDPLCYWNPTFADDSYSATAGCRKPPLGTAGFGPYEETWKATWDLPPAAMTPGDLVTLALAAEASATPPSRKPRVYLWVDIPNWGADVAPPTPFGEFGLSPPTTRVTLISPGTTTVRFRVRPGFEGDTVGISMQVALADYPLNPGDPIMSRGFQYVYHTR